MPLGFGYGAVGKAFQAIASGLSHGVSAAKPLAQKIWSTPMGRAATIGAGTGAMYGAFSDDTSILGGAMKGAGLGVAAYAGYGAARTGIGRYGNLTRQGMGRGQALSQVFGMAAEDSSQYIGNTITKAANGFKAMSDKFKL